MQNQILTNRSIVKQDRISKILSNYKTEIDKHSQQSFRMLSQKIKRKIGNQISDNQAKYPIPKNKTEVSRFFSDHSKSQFQISVKDLLLHKSQIQKLQSKKPKDDKQMVPRINKIQNDIFKNYLAQRNCNGSKTYRDSNVRIKMSDKSTHSQQALLQTLINKSYENKFNEPRDSPELCYASQHIFKLLQQSINGQSSLLLRSGSQGNVANTSSSNNKTADPKFNKIKTFLESTKTFHSNTDPYKLTTDQELLQAKSKFVKVNQSKIQSLLQIANKIKNTMDALNQILIKQEKTSSIISNLISYELSSRDSIESIFTLE
ncbi:unnamed protein product (macronuclear) [Paramecium tetraurelia]|uniref:Uncharacterized protein n=1 Tax=Paramecium tetraurelia TaxID=5888 RepID=A0CA08_PARTE|nr:uncharacterized protein GSPATT00036404001 [Paramecium tetraurelia]CAK67625.1 unnamed protein product [Paramecium tetraurelia]|eukprot:XP_001435022.1 hypothetical protein (macronuclear) [Paramecium tetraurelia strain d4-2]